VDGKTQPPLLGWSRNNTLSILASENDRKNFYMYENLGTKKVKVKLKRNIRGLDQIVDMDVSHDGTMLAVSADKGGQNDLFLISVARASALPLTNDLYDDLSPVLYRDLRERLFLLRIGHSIRSAPVTRGTINPYRHHSRYLSTTVRRRSDNLVKLVQAEGKNKVTPVYSDENDLIYLSNEKGVSNLFKYNRASATSSQLTNYIQNIRNADVTIKSGGALAYTYLNDGYYTAAFKNGFDINATVNHAISECIKRQWYRRGESASRKNRLSATKAHRLWKRPSLH
jgi:hypothetical protein